MNLQEFLKKTMVVKTHSDGYAWQEIRPRIVCKDGVSLSVQASQSHYCSPRMDNSDYYLDVEVGYPSVRPPSSWKEYYDGEWQEEGIFGWMKRVWEKRDQIIRGFKQYLKGDRLSLIVLRYNLSLKDDATLSVYAYVPTVMVEKFIEDHGGIDEEKTFSVKRKE